MKIYIVMGQVKFLNVLKRGSPDSNSENIQVSVDYYLLGISPAFELSESTFRNLVSGPSS
jgi:hypothetical protein